MARDKDKKDKDAAPAGLPGDTIRFAPNGDYSHGHPGVPVGVAPSPKDKDKPGRAG